MKPSIEEPRKQGQRMYERGMNPQFDIFPKGRNSIPYGRLTKRERAILHAKIRADAREIAIRFGARTPKSLLRTIGS